MSARRRGNAGAHRRALAGVGGLTDQPGLHLAIPLDPVGHRLAGRVAAAVVDDDQLPLNRHRHGRDLVQHRRNRAGLVVGGNDDAQQAVRGPRNRIGTLGRHQDVTPGLRSSHPRKTDSISGPQ